MASTPGARLRWQQAADPGRYPALLSTARPAAVAGGLDANHRLVEAIEPPRLAHTPEAAAALLQAVDWRSKPSPGSSPDSTPPPAQEGWLVYLAYECSQGLWPQRLQLRRPPRDHEPLPLLAAVQRIRLGEPEWERSAATAVPPLVAQAAWREPDPAVFLADVDRIREYIRAGDVYQVNLSRSWRTRVPADGTAVYERLLRANPAPFAARWTLPGLDILSSSPERLFAVRGNTIHTQPIAGTRPRGVTAADDARLRSELQAHPKERAEHIMLVDLERNDLGRICAGGSVTVPQLMRIEPYTTVQHMVSDVYGQLRSDVRLWDILAAVFPGGTITGCPKLRCMEILCELESEPRGAYTGSLGYCLDDGSADFNILIRTVQSTAAGLRLDAGAGIVADADARAELAETRAKAEGVIAALAGHRRTEEST
ncbi:MAG: chorismate-binding protein [Oceanococcaceae bacterium]